MHTKVNDTAVLHSSDVRVIMAGCEHVTSRRCIVLNVYFRFTAFVFPFFAFVGITTNIMTICIFARMMGKPIQRQHFLLVCLALSQVISLMLPTFYQLPSYGFYFLFGEAAVWNFNEMSPTGCKALYCLYSITASCVTNIFLLATCDRFATMRYPLRMRSLTVATTARLAVIIFLFSFLSGIIYSPDVNYRSSGDDFTCSFTAHNLVWMTYMIVLSRACLLQIFLIIVGNVLLMVEVRKATRRRLSLMNNVTLRVREVRQSRRNLLSGAALQLIQSVIYLCSALPPAILTTTSGMLDHFNAAPVLKQEFLAWAFFMEYFFYIQGIVNFVIYLVRLPKYREAFLKIATCGLSKKKKNVKVYNSQRPLQMQSTKF